MPSDRLWAIIISAVLLTAFVVNRLWEKRRLPRFDAIATFDGYVDRSSIRSQHLTVAWPSKGYAMITVTKVLDAPVRSRATMGYRPGELTIALPDHVLKTNQGRPLVRGQTYSFHFSRRIFFRSSFFNVEIHELPAKHD